MSHFLIVYDRANGTLVSIDEYEDASDALRERFEVERTQTDDFEVVVLSGESEDALHQTHARYFKTASELTAAS